MMPTFEVIAETSIKFFYISYWDRTIEILVERYCIKSFSFFIKNTYV